MADEETPQIEQLLVQARGGAPDAVEHLAEAVYDELRAVADNHLRRRFGQAAACLTWQPTVLVNETLLRMVKKPRQYDGRGQFFAIATKVMKRVLLDYFRKRHAIKRGGGRIRVELDPEVHAAIMPGKDEPDMEALFQAIERLKSINARKADVVDMRILWGFTLQEIAEALDISIATAERDWSFASAWLTRELAARGTDA